VLARLLSKAKVFSEGSEEIEILFELVLRRMPDFGLQ